MPLTHHQEGHQPSSRMSALRVWELGAARLEVSALSRPAFASLLQRPLLAVSGRTAGVCVQTHTPNPHNLGHWILGLRLPLECTTNITAQGAGYKKNCWIGEAPMTLHLQLSSPNTGLTAAVMEFLVHLQLNPANPL